MPKKIKRSRPWTEEEVRMLKTLAREQTKTTVIGQVRIAVAMSMFERVSEKYAAAVVVALAFHAGAAMAADAPHFGQPISPADAARFHTAWANCGLPRCTNIVGISPRGPRPCSDTRGRGRVPPVQQAGAMTGQSEPHSATGRAGAERGHRQPREGPDARASRQHAQFMTIMVRA